MGGAIIYYIEGIYGAGPELASITVGDETNLGKSLDLLSTSFCVRTDATCRDELDRKSDLRGGFVAQYTNLAYVKAIVRYAGNFNEMDCPFGRVEILHLISVRKANKQELSLLRSRWEAILKEWKWM